MKDRFIEFLKDNGIYAEFVLELMYQRNYAISEFLEDATRYKYLIGAFDWERSVSGIDYWNKYKEMWDGIVRKQELKGNRNEEILPGVVINKTDKILTFDYTDFVSVEVVGEERTINNNKHYLRREYLVTVDSTIKKC